MTVVEVPRAAVEEPFGPDPHPPHWVPSRRGDGSPSAWLSCPRCGRWGSLIDHTIQPDGTVRPSVLIAHDAQAVCWHSDDPGVKLLGWTP